MINLINESLTPEEAAKLLSVHKNTLINMGKEGKLKPIRINGGHRRYSIYELVNYIKYQPATANVIIDYEKPDGDHEQELENEADYVTLMVKDNRLKDCDMKKLVRLIVTKQVKCLILHKANSELCGLNVIRELCKYHAVTVKIKE